VGEEASGSLDTTPTAGGKLLAVGPPLRGSLRQKYTAPARDSTGVLSTVDEDTVAASSGAVPGQLDGGHARQPSDDAGLRLFAGESSSAAVWDAAPDMEAAVGQQQQQQQGPHQPAMSKRLELKVVVPVDGGDDAKPSAHSEGKHLVLEVGRRCLNAVLHGSHNVQGGWWRLHLGWQGLVGAVLKSWFATQSREL